MIKFKFLYLSLILIIFSTNSYAVKMIGKINKNEAPDIENFQDYKEYRIKQLKDLKQLGIVDNKFIESELDRIKKFEESAAKIKFIRNGSKINALMCFNLDNDSIQDFERIDGHNKELICNNN
tara:strand:+ start:379 stop:747 length:369 start_codon:yes stop_codon:yes gene_type:complete